MPEAERSLAWVAQLEAIAGQYFAAPLPRSLQEYQIFNAEPTPSTSHRRQHNNDDDIIPGKATPPSNVNRNRERLEGVLLQLPDVCIITGIRHE